MPESDQLRQNISAQFRGLLALIQRSGEQSRPDIEGKITVASEAWRAGHADLATSLLLDAFIKMYAGKPTSGQSVLTADRTELAMASEDASLVFMRAFLLAQRSKAPEIRIEHLLAALDEDMPLAVESSIRPEPPFLPVPHQDLPLSPGAAAALGAVGGDIFHVSLKALRNVLLDAPRRGAT